MTVSQLTTVVLYILLTRVNRRHYGVTSDGSIVSTSLSSFRHTENREFTPLDVSHESLRRRDTRNFDGQKTVAVKTARTVNLANL